MPYTVVTMNFLNQIYSTFLYSISNPKHYVLFLNHTFRFSLFYYLLSYFLIGSLIGIHTVQFRFPTLIDDTQQILHQVDSNYPSDYVFDWNGLELMTSPSQIEIPYPEKINNSSGDQNLVYFDTSTSNLEQIMENIPKSSTFVISKTDIAITTSAGTTSEPLESLGLIDMPLVITRDNIGSKISSILEKFDQLLPTIKILTLVLTPILLAIYRFLILILDCFLGFLIFKVWGTPISYKKVFQLGLHIAIPAEIVHQISKIVYLDNQIHLYSLTFWIMFSLIIFNLRNVKTIPKIKLR